MNSLVLLLLSVGLGLAASGIVANLYRLCITTVERPSERVFRAVVLIFAGPCLVLESAVAGLRNKRWNVLQFSVVLAVTAYWSFGLGLFLVDLGIHL